MLGHAVSLPAVVVATLGVVVVVVVGLHRHHCPALPALQLEARGQTDLSMQGSDPVLSRNIQHI